MIYIAHGFDLAQLAEPLSRWLSADERVQLQSYASAARQRQYLVGRGLLRWLACTEIGCSASDVTIQRQASGAPQLMIAGQSLACSISHKDDAVLVAFGEVEALGVDVEKLTARQRHADLIAKFADGFMRDVTHGNLQAFYERWTLAESVTKAEQGKLLATLRRSATLYEKFAVFHYEHGHEFCCYSPQLLFAAKLRWWRVSNDKGQLDKNELDI